MLVSKITLIQHSSTNILVPNGLTLRKKLTVCFGTLRDTPVESKDIYTYSFWYKVHHGERLDYIEKKWLRMDHIRTHRVLADAQRFHNAILQPVTNVHSRRLQNSSDYFRKIIHIVRRFPNDLPLTNILDIKEIVFPKIHYSVVLMLVVLKNQLRELGS